MTKLGKNILELHKQGISVRDIADQLHCSLASVRYWIYPEKYKDCLGKQAKNKYKTKNKIAARKFVSEHKITHGCSICGLKSSNAKIFDCHHKTDKKKLISKMVADGYKISSIKKELSKCQILCANCHRKLHFTGAVYNNQKAKYILRLKSQSYCSLCRYKDPSGLDFHHKDPSTKIMHIGQMIRTKKYSLDDLKLEVSKCVVICSNCHRALE